MKPLTESILAQRTLMACPRLASLDTALREMAVKLPNGLKRALVVAPHSDDAEISLAATIMHMVHSRIEVTVALVYSGFRCPGLADEPCFETRTRRRVQEAKNACNITGAAFHFYNAGAYTRENYLPSDEDIEQVADHLMHLRPDVVFVPPRFDHAAHQAARELAALGVYEAGLSQCRFITYDSPWNCLGGATPPTHFFAFCDDLWSRKKLAIEKFESQLEATDYVAFAKSHGEAWKAKARESIVGHHATESWCEENETIGLEVFRMEEFDVHATRSPWPDPVHLVLQGFQTESKPARPVPAPV